MAEVKPILSFTSSGGTDEINGKILSMTGVLLVPNKQALCTLYFEYIENGAYQREIIQQEVLSVATHNDMEQWAQKTLERTINALRREFKQESST